MYIAQLKLGQYEQPQPGLVKVCVGYDNYLITATWPKAIAKY